MQHRQIVNTPSLREHPVIHCKLYDVVACELVSDEWRSMFVDTILKFARQKHGGDALTGLNKLLATHD